MVKKPPQTTWAEVGGEAKICSKCCTCMNLPIKSPLYEQKNLIYVVGTLKYIIEIQGTHDEGKILKTCGCFSIICMQQGIPTCDEQDFSVWRCYVTAFCWQGTLNPKLYWDSSRGPLFIVHRWQCLSIIFIQQGFPTFEQEFILSVWRYIVYIDPTHLPKWYQQANKILKTNCCFFEAFTAHTSVSARFWSQTVSHLVQFCFINVRSETGDKGLKGKTVITIYHCLIPSMWNIKMEKKDIFETLWKYVSKDINCNTLIDDKMM